MVEPSPESLKLPEPLLAVLREYDERTDDFDEAELSFLLEAKLKDVGETTEVQRMASLAEIAALQLSLAPDREKSLWGTRYEPFADITGSDGKRRVSPDIPDFDDAVVQYWSQRATEVTHPVLKGRYADVLWDLTKAITSRKPSIETARQAIDAYIDCGRRFPNSENAEIRLQRALELALSVGDQTRAGKVFDGLVQLACNADFPGCPRILSIFDLLTNQKGFELSPEQHKRLIDAVEAQLQEACGSAHPDGLGAVGPALRLAKYYTGVGKLHDVKRVICAYGGAVADLASHAQGLVGMQWLQDAYAIFIQFGLKEEAEQFQLAAKQKAEQARSEMARQSYSVEIPEKDVEVFLEAVTEGDLETTLTRIAWEFLPKADEIRKQLEEMKKKAKTLSMIPQAKLDQNQVIARAGSIESDPEGRFMFQMADNIRWMADWLAAALDRTRAKFDFSVPTILPFILKSPLFDRSRGPLFERAIHAYLKDDHITAVHILVPQIENSLRRLLAMLGRPTNKHRRSDLSVMIEKSLNDILESEPAIQECLGEDVTLYLRVFLCDPRGFNVRNDLAHGLMEPKQFSRFISDRLLHIVWLLALLQASDPPAVNNTTSSVR